MLGIDTDYAHIIREMAIQTGCPANRINTVTTLMPEIGMRELTLCLDDFDSPRAAPENVRYIEPCLRDEEEDEFPWVWGDPERRSVFLRF